MGKKWMVQGGLAAVLMVLLLTGCSNRRLEEELKFRTKGIEAMKQQDYEEALKNFQLALDQASGKYSEVEKDICYYKAEALMSTGNKQEARKVYDALAEYDTQNPKVFFLRGNLLLEENEVDLAVADYDKATELEPERYEMFLEIYEKLNSAGRNKEADFFLRKALLIKKDEAEDRMKKGDICILLRDYKKAEEYLLKAKENKVVKADFLLASVYKELGDSEKSHQALNDYLGNPEAGAGEICMLGEEAYHNKDYATAIACFQAGIALKNAEFDQRMMKGCISAYEFSGDFQSANTLMKDYIAKYPEDTEAQRERIFLETRLDP